MKVCAAGADILVDHKREIRNVSSLAEQEHAGEVYGTFANGYVSESLSGKSMSLEELREPVAAALVAEAFATFHSLSPPPGEETNQAWHATLDQ